MVIDPYLLFINTVGIFIGIVFIFINIGVGKILTDPALKDYFRWVNFGIVFFVLSFATEFSKIIIDPNIADGIHHLLLILFIIIFAMASLNLLQEMKQSSK